MGRKWDCGINRGTVGRTWDRGAAVGRRTGGGERGGDVLRGLRQLGDAHLEDAELGALRDGVAHRQLGERVVCAAGAQAQCGQRLQ